LVLLAESDLGGLRRGVFIADVTVNPQGEDAVVLVPQPGGDGANIDAGVDAAGREQMPERVVCRAGHPHLGGGSVHRLLALADFHHEVLGLGFWAIRPQAFKQGSHRRDDGNEAVEARLGARHWIADDVNPSGAKIDVSPTDVGRFGFAEPAEGEEAHQVGARPGPPRAAGFDGPHEGVELRRRRQCQAGRLDRGPLEAAGGIVVAAPKSVGRDRQPGMLSKVPRD